MGIHFFEDDRYFERVWTHPEKYIHHLKKFRFVTSPDFSIYKDAPNPIKEWNLYRSRMLSIYWQEKGIKVIPTVPFGGYDFNHYAMIGLQPGSAIAISTVGSRKRFARRRDFQAGLDTICARLKPSQILVYGKTDGFDFHDVLVTSFAPYGAKYQWHSVRMIDGVKVLRHNTKKNGSLPLYSHKENDVYMHENSDGKINQIRIYRKGRAAMDIDWGHSHGPFKAGTAHVHIYRLNPYTKELNKVLTKAFALSHRMQKKYGPLIRKVNPNIKF